MPVTERLRGLRIAHWLGLSVAIMALEYYSGPHIQFAIRPVGIALATCLPLVRLSFSYFWRVEWSWSLVIADALIDVVILVGTVMLIARMARQEEELRILEGLLPICSFCKRIRDEGGQWRQLESYIAARSPARFSHTFCSECGRRHYPGLAD